MTISVVLADANILFSRTLRDWLLLVHLDGGPIRVHYTEDILAETVCRLRREHPSRRGLAGVTWSLAIRSRRST